MTERRVVFGLGSNLGSRASLLRAAADLIAATHGLTLVGRSRIFETPPIGPAQPDYMNAALCVHTALPAPELLNIALSIEQRLGRERRQRWGARTLDIDILWIDGESFSNASLTVPHPELLERAFALAPLLDVAADARDPRTNAALATRLEALAPASPFTSFAWTDHVEATLTDTFSGCLSVQARNRADLLAAASEAVAARIVDPADVSARVVTPLELLLAAGEDAPHRLTAWLSLVLSELAARPFAVRRAVLFEDAPALIRGALIGEALDPSRHHVRQVPGRASVERIDSTLDWHADVTLE